MKTLTFPLLALVTALAFSSPGLAAAAPPPGAQEELLPQGAIHVDPARRTVLSTGLATSSSGVRPHVANFMLLWASASGKNSETMTWKLDVPVGGTYSVEALVQAGDGHLKLGVNGGQPSEFHVRKPMWDRVALGTVSLAKGENFLELEIPAGRPVSISALELIHPEVDEMVAAEAMSIRQSPDWFKDAGYGLMFQWTNRATPPAGGIKPWNQKVDDFNLASVIELVEQSGASFVVWSVTWGQQYISAPNQSLDRILPGRTTKRDLLGELADGLKARGVRLIFYYHYGYDCYHSKDPEWLKASGGCLPDKTALYQNIGSILGEIGNRYGDKLDGWFLDGGHRYYDAHFDGSPPIGVTSAPFRELALAARTGNAKRVLCFNSWVLPRLTEYQDYFAGEGQIRHVGLEQGRFVDGPQEGLMAFGCFTLESRWGHIDKNRVIAPPKYSADALVQNIKHAKASRYPIAINLEMYEDGSVGPDSAALLQDIGRMLGQSAGTSQEPGKH
jgi:hypothetical protein